MLRHQRRCNGPVPGIEDEDHEIRMPAGQGVYGWACGYYRRTIWLDPDFCCATCKALLLTAGELPS